MRLTAPAVPSHLIGRTVCQDLVEALPHLPPGFVDLLIVDPPYNLAKSFNGRAFKPLADNRYERWIDSWLCPLSRVLKPSASIYICCDWRCSASVQRVGERYFRVQNRITWEREKGRGAHRNWKNCSEDIWFFTVSGDFTFNVDAVKMRRRVVAPYTTANGQPKDCSPVRIPAVEPGPDFDERDVAACPCTGLGDRSWAPAAISRRIR